MAVDQERGSGQQAGVHAHTFAVVHLDEHEAFPLLAVAFGLWFQLLKKSFFKFQDFFDVHAGDEGLSGGDGSVDEEDVLEFIIAGRQDGSALVDLGGVEQVEDGKMLDSQDAVHALEAQAALTIQEVGDVSLFKASLLRQTEAGQVAFLDALPKRFAQVILQYSEFHGREYNTARYSTMLSRKDFHRPFGLTTLTRKIRSYTIAILYNPTSSSGTFRHDRCG